MRVACFDLDGCLVDSRSPITAALNHGLASVGASPRPRSELEGWIGTPLLEVYQGLLAATGQDPGLAADAIVGYRDVYGDLAVRDTTVVDGMAAVLADLADAGWQLLVVTTKPVPFADPILRAVGLRDAFDDVFAPDVTALTEPKAVTLRRALDAIAVPPEDVAPTWMVGDRHHDVDAGVAVGTRTAGVTWGAGSRAELEAAGATIVVDTPAELGDALLG